MAERQKLRLDAPRLGLKALIGGRSLQEIALELLDLAHQGLTSRARINAAGDNDNSVVLRVSFGHRSILLPGDIESSAEQYLAAGLPAGRHLSDCHRDRILADYCRVHHWPDSHRVDHEFCRGYG